MIHQPYRFIPNVVGHGLAALILLNLTARIALPQQHDLLGNGMDRYGGTLAVKSEATGFFRVEQIGGRWWLITPDGNGFLSAGVNHVDYREDYSDQSAAWCFQALSARRALRRRCRAW